MANLVTQWQQSNALLRSELARQASKFNNPDLSNIDIKFSGTLQDIYKWEQTVRAAINMYELPNGVTGANEDKFNGTVAQINWGNNLTWNTLHYNVRVALNEPQLGAAPTAAQLAGQKNQLPPLANQS